MAGAVLVDTHCHLGDEQFADDLADVLRRARDDGVGHVVAVADSVAAGRAAVDIARRFGLSATAGVHPHVATTWSPEAEEAVRASLAMDEVVAVGETGLDYHYDFSPRAVQRRAFEAQLRLGEESGLPVVVHAREADDDMAAMIRQTTARLVLHSFGAGAGVFEAGMDADAYVSFSGMVTFKRWQGVNFVREVPPHRLLVETDAPYLAPVPHRGRRNEPAYVKHVAARVAEMRGVGADTVAALTAQNAADCFGPRMTRGM